MVAGALFTALVAALLAFAVAAVVAIANRHDPEQRRRWNVRMLLSLAVVFLVLGVVVSLLRSG